MWPGWFIFDVGLFASYARLMKEEYDINGAIMGSSSGVIMGLRWGRSKAT